MEEENQPCPQPFINSNGQLQKDPLPSNRQKLQGEMKCLCIKWIMLFGIASLSATVPGDVQGAWASQDNLYW